MYYVCQREAPRARASAATARGGKAVAALYTEKSLGAPQSCADLRDNQLMRAKLQAPTLSARCELKAGASRAQSERAAAPT